MAYNAPLIQPSGNVTLLGVSLAGVPWAIPAAATDLLGVVGFRMPVPWTYASEWRVVAQLTAGAFGGAKLRAKYSLTSGGALVDLGTGGDVTVDAAAVVAGTWTSIPTGARANTFVTVQGLDGNGIAAAVFTFLALQYR